ncbi:hypothetical protein ACFV1C_36345, partial [Streptomyces sp. NPDC059605]
MRPGDAVTARTRIGGVPVPRDGPAALPGADGSVELFCRAAAKAALTTVRPGRTAAGAGLGGPAHRAVDLPGLDGYGAVAAARTPRGPVLLGRTAKGLVRLRTPDGTVVRRTDPR